MTGFSHKQVKMIANREFIFIFKKRKTKRARYVANQIDP